VRGWRICVKIECITFIMNSMYNVYNEVSVESSRCSIVGDRVCC
jgi:hypothetical protein